MAALGAVFLTSAAAIAVLRLNPEKIIAQISADIEKVTHAAPVYEDVRIQYFPWPALVLREVRLGLPSDHFSTLEAEEIRIYLKIFSALWGQLETLRIKILDASLVVRFPGLENSPEFNLEHLTIKVSRLAWRKPMRIDLSGDLEGNAGVIRGFLRLQLNPSDTWLSFAELQQMHFELENMPLKSFQPHLEKIFEVGVEGGMMSGSLDMEKEPGSQWLRCAAQMASHEFVYRTFQDGNLMRSPELNVSWGAQFRYEPLKGEIQVLQSKLEMPFGHFETTGWIYPETKELRDMLVRVGDLSVENIPQYYLPFQRVIPLNLGFSGQSQMEMSLNGPMDHLTINGNWNLYDMLLSYAGYFSKERNVPLDSSFDFLLKEGKTLSGDFSLKFEKAVAKGTFSELALSTGQGQVNIISNKFPVSGWEAMILPLKNNKLQGDLKVLANFKGDLTRLSEAEPMLNLTLERINVLNAAQEASIKNIYASIDYGKLGLRAKQVRFEAAGSEVEAELTVYPSGETPILEGALRSPALAYQSFFKALRNYQADVLPPVAEEAIRQLESWLLRILPPEAVLENFEMQFKRKGNLWEMPVFKFEAFGGAVKSSGGINFENKPPLVHGSMEVDRLNLARYFKDRDPVPMAGNLFLRWSGKGHGVTLEKLRTSFKGTGELSVTNGEVATVDLVSALSEIADLELLEAEVRGRTVFGDIRGEFTIDEGKVETQNLVLKSSEISLRGNGHITLDGFLNYRANAFLSSSLTKKLLLNSSQDLLSQKEPVLGPVPILISGPLTRPEIQPDPVLLPKYRKMWFKGSAYATFDSFLPEEDLLLERAKSS